MRLGETLSSHFNPGTLTARKGQIYLLTLVVHHQLPTLVRSVILRICRSPAPYTLAIRTSPFPHTSALNDTHSIQPPTRSHLLLSSSIVNPHCCQRLLYSPQSSRLLAVITLHLVVLHYNILTPRYPPAIRIPKITTLTNL